MGQQEIIKFLKENAEAYFSVEDLSETLGINKQTAYSLLRKLKESDDLEYKEIIPKQGPIKKMYCYRLKDDFWEEAWHDFNWLKKKDAYSTLNSDLLLSLLLLKELKIINKRIEHIEEMTLNEPKKE